MSDKSGETPSSQMSSQNYGDQFTRMANSTVQSGMKAFSRLVQRTEEAIGTSDVTPLDPTVETLLARSDVYKRCIDQLLYQAECLVEPDTIKKGTKKLLDALDFSQAAGGRQSYVKRMSDFMEQSSHQLTTSTTFGSALAHCSAAFKEAGQAELDFYYQVENKFIKPLRTIILTEYRNVTVCKTQLFNTRLDLDSLKGRLRKNPEDQHLLSECRRVNSEFEMLSLKVQNLLEEFCGSVGQGKLSTLLYGFAEMMHTYHSKSSAIFDGVKKQ